MPRFDDVTKGVAFGIGVAILIPVAFRALAPVLKPVARSAVKNGILVIEKGREIMAETSEKIEDLVAETQEEMRAKRMTTEEDIDQAPVDQAEQPGQPDDQSNVRNIVNE